MSIAFASHEDVSPHLQHGRANILIAGAGSTGFGMAHVLRDFAIPEVRRVERKQIEALGVPLEEGQARTESRRASS